MARPARKYVAEIEASLALLFARACCDRQGLAYNDDSGQTMWWAGAFLHGTLRAVIGIAYVQDKHLFVSGIYHDGSAFAEKASKMIVDRLCDLRCIVEGTMGFPNVRAQKYFQKRSRHLVRR